jgi:hypothetical protein
LKPGVAKLVEDVYNEVQNSEQDEAIRLVSPPGVMKWLAQADTQPFIDGAFDVVLKDLERPLFIPVTKGCLNPNETGESRAKISIEGTLALAALQLLIFGPEIIGREMKPNDYNREKGGRWPMIHGGEAGPAKFGIYSADDMYSALVQVLYMITRRCARQANIFANTAPKRSGERLVGFLPVAVPEEFEEATGVEDTFGQYLTRTALKNAMTRDERTRSQEDNPKKPRSKRTAIDDEAEETNMLWHEAMVESSTSARPDATRAELLAVNNLKDWEQLTEDTIQSIVESAKKNHQKVNLDGDKGFVRETRNTFRSFVPAQVLADYIECSEKTETFKKLKAKMSAEEYASMIEDAKTEFCLDRFMNAVQQPPEVDFEEAARILQCESFPGNRFTPDALGSQPLKHHQVIGESPKGREISVGSDYSIDDQT